MDKDKKIREVKASWINIVHQESFVSVSIEQYEQRGSQYPQFILDQIKHIEESDADNNTD